VFYSGDERDNVVGVLTDGQQKNQTRYFAVITVDLERLTEEKRAYAIPMIMVRANFSARDYRFVPGICIV
jgi:hypothetical protein